ncbi:Rha family transcriptional regulator [Bordetella trematum]|uniref:Rha family transcriptional regulator n=1 Tax=Bordetella trematum TaxID=123899 RepID=UPI00068B06E3|nr:Rha family transcriptional regulator [Bordetella trematum]
MATTTKEKGRDSGKSATPTTSTHDTALILHHVKEEPRIDSRVLAQHLGNKHQSVRELLADYAKDFRELGILRFETGASPGSKTGQKEKYAMLNEDQAYLLLTYSRNTATVRALKVRLVKAFSEARQARDLTRTEYLPTYHALHDEISALAGQSANAKYAHLNINRLVNKTVGIGSGQRSHLDAPRRSLLVAAQYLASTAMHGAGDHKEGYALAKHALDRFGVALARGGHAR